MNVDSAFDHFYDTILNEIDDNVPKMTKRKYSQKPNWWNKEIKRKKNRRDKLYKRRITIMMPRIFWNMKRR